MTVQCVQTVLLYHPVVCVDCYPYAHVRRDAPRRIDRSTIDYSLLYYYLVAPTDRTRSALFTVESREPYRSLP